MKRSIWFLFLSIFLALSYLSLDCQTEAIAGIRNQQRHKAWVSFIIDAPGQASWVRINTQGNGASFAFDFGQAQTVPLLALPLSAPPIQMFIAQHGMPAPGQPFMLPGGARVDVNNIIPVMYNVTIESGTAWMMVTGMPLDVLRQCAYGKTLRFKIDVGGMSYFYNFSLIGFTAAMRHAVSLYQSLFGSSYPDSSYF